MFLGVGSSRLRMSAAVVILALSCHIALGAQKAKLAVVDFQTKGKIEEKQAGEIVAGLFGTSLSDKYIILERQQIAKVITEQKFQLTDLVADRNKATRIGKLLGADHIVVGTVSQLGKTVTVEARVVNVATGQWGERGYIYCKGIGEVPKNLPALLSKMKLLGKGGLSTPVPEEVTGPLSAREETFKALIAKGTAALNAGNPAAAKKMAEQAIEIPGYKNDADAAFLLKRAREDLKQARKDRYDRAVAASEKALADDDYGTACGHAEIALDIFPDAESTRSLLEKLATTCERCKGTGKILRDVYKYHWGCNLCKFQTQTTESRPTNRWLRKPCPKGCSKEIVVRGRFAGRDTTRIVRGKLWLGKQEKRSVDQGCPDCRGAGKIPYKPKAHRQED